MTDFPRTLRPDCLLISATQPVRQDPGLGFGKPGCSRYVGKNQEIISLIFWFHAELRSKRNFLETQVSACAGTDRKASATI